MDCSSVSFIVIKIQGFPLRTPTNVKGLGFLLDFRGVYNEMEEVV